MSQQEPHEAQRCLIPNLGKSSLRHQNRLSAEQLESNPAENIWASWQTSWTWTSNIPSWQRQPKPFLAALGRISPVSWGRWSFLLLSSSEVCLEYCVPACAPQYKGDMDVLKWEEKRTPDRILYAVDFGQWEHWVWGFWLCKFSAYCLSI